MEDDGVGCAGECGAGDRAGPGQRRDAGDKLYLRRNGALDNCFDAAIQRDADADLQLQFVDAPVGKRDASGDGNDELHLYAGWVHQRSADLENGR